MHLDKVLYNVLVLLLLYICNYLSYGIYMLNWFMLKCMVAITFHHMKFEHYFLSKLTTIEACTLSSSLKSSNIDYIKHKFEYVLLRSAIGCSESSTNWAGNLLPRNTWTELTITVPASELSS